MWRTYLHPESRDKFVLSAWQNTAAFVNRVVDVDKIDDRCNIQNYKPSERANWFCMISSGIRCAPRLYWLALFEIRAFVVRMCFDVNFSHEFTNTFEFTTTLINWLVKLLATEIRCERQKTVDWRMLWKNAIRSLKVMEYNSIQPFVFNFRKIALNFVLCIKEITELLFIWHFRLFFPLFLRTLFNVWYFPPN